MLVEKTGSRANQLLIYVFIRILERVIFSQITTKNSVYTAGYRDLYLFADFNLPRSRLPVVHIFIALKRPGRMGPPLFPRQSLRSTSAWTICRMKFGNVSPACLSMVLC
jgi:hypothetical protein